jgi:hypothetical protein
MKSNAGARSRLHIRDYNVSSRHLAAGNVRDTCRVAISPASARIVSTTVSGRQPSVPFAGGVRTEYAEVSVPRVGPPPMTRASHRWRLAARQHGCDRGEEAAPVKARREALRLPVDVPAARHGNSTDKNCGGRACGKQARGTAPAGSTHPPLVATTRPSGLPASAREKSA